MERNRYLHRPKSEGYMTAVLYDGTKEAEKELRKTFPGIEMEEGTPGNSGMAIRSTVDGRRAYLPKGCYLACLDVTLGESRGWTGGAGGIGDRYLIIPKAVFEEDHVSVTLDQELASGVARREDMEGEPYEDVIQHSKNLLEHHRATYPEYVPYPGRPNSPAGPGSPIMLVTDERGYFQMVFEDTIIPMNRAIRFSVEETVERVTEVTATFAVEMGRRNPDLDKSDKNV